MISRVKEVEVKYRVPQNKVKKFINILKKTGAKFLGEQQEFDTYYSRPDKNFIKTRECLRIRTTAEKSELTYKPATTKKMRKNKKFWKKEVDINITGQVEEINELLQDLEYKKLITVVKRRKKNKIYDVEITVDFIKKLGYFIELEVKSDDEVYALQTLDSYAVKFGLNEDGIVNKPYRDLLMETKK